MIERSMIKGFGRALAVIAAMALLGMGDASAKPANKDRKYASDWQTGVELAPGSYTWTNENFEEKKQIIANAAAAEARTCSDYAFLQWPPDAGTIDALRAETRRNYEVNGYAIEEKPGPNAGDTIWIARHAEREAVILWAMGASAPVYLSCITAGAPFESPDKPIVLGVLLGLGLGAIGAGLWMIRRVRGQGKASLGWPTAAGIVKTSEIASYRVKGGHQFQARATYSYAVNGRPYSGDRIRFGNYAGAKSVAEEDVARYRPGASVEVRYNPSDPSVSVLEPGTKGHSVLGLVLAIMGAIFVGLALMVAFI